MLRVFVCKTVVAHPGPVQYVARLDRPGTQLDFYDSIAELAWDLWRSAPPSLPPQEPRYLKNEVPFGDLFWDPKSGASASVTHFERLSRKELLDLGRRLREGRQPEADVA